MPEVGGLGQARLRESTLSARSEIEALYLAAAGIGVLTVPTTEIAEAVAGLNPDVRVRVDEALAPAADDVEAAALAAWRKLKEALSL